MVFVFLSFASPVFLSADNLFNIGSQTAVMAVIAIGMTLVIITAGIDLSVGSVSALSGVLGVMMMAQAGLPVPCGDPRRHPGWGYLRARQRAPRIGRAASTRS